MISVTLLPSYQLILYKKLIQSIIIILKGENSWKFLKVSKPTWLVKMLVSFSLKGKNLVFFKRLNGLVKETEVIPVLLGNPEKIKIYLEIEGIMDGYEVIDPQHYPQFEEMVAALVERRKGKNV